MSASKRGTVKGPSARAQVEVAVRHIKSAEQNVLKIPDAPIWALEQAYLLLAEQSKGIKKRGYLKRAVLLRMLLVELRG